MTPRERVQKWLLGVLGDYRKKDVDQTAVGKLYGVNQSMISKYKNGKALPRGEVLVKMCEEEGVSPSWLLFGVGPKTLNELRAVWAAHRHADSALDRYGNEDGSATG